jgi:hypothetical protein
VSDSGEVGTRSFRPGPWFGIFGDRTTVLLPPSEKARVAALWELIDDGAGFDEVLDALIAGGLRELPGFVLVSERDGETKVVLRGAARATFVADGQTLELEGSSATTWVERSLPGVTRMVLRVADEADGPAHTIAGGLVRLARVDEPSYSPHAPHLVDGEASPVGDNAADEAEVEPADDGAGAEDAPADEMSSVVEPTSLEEPAGEARSDGQGSDEDDDVLVHDLPTEAVDIPASWTPSAPPAPTALPAPPASPTSSTPPAPPAPWGAPPAAAADDAPTRAVATLAFSSGERLDVDRAILIGRAPRARQHPSSVDPRLVSVPSPHQEISSTHREVRPGAGAHHGSAVVTDLGSTNGTVLVQPGLPPEDLLAGITVLLQPGAILDLGDGVTIQVSTPGAAGGS